MNKFYKILLVFVLIITEVFMCNTIIENATSWLTKKIMKLHNTQAITPL